MYKEVPQVFYHQGQALDFIEDKPVFALFMEQGTGKSKVIIEQVTKLWERKEIDCVIVISPNAVKEQWVIEQFEKHFPSTLWKGYIWDNAKTLKSKNRYNKCLKDSNLFIFSIGIEALQSDYVVPFIKLTLEERNCFIVIDESTRIKNGRRKTKGKRAGAKRTNRILDLFENVKYKAILTGTPTPNSPFDLWSQFEFLKKDFFGMDYFYFEHHHGILIGKKSIEGRSYTSVLDEKTYSIIKNKLSKFEKITPQIIEELAVFFSMKTKDILLIKNMDEYQPYKNLDELKKKISKITFFIKKEDCLDLPDKIYEKLYCTMSKEQTKIYKQLKKEMYSKYETKELTVTNKMVLYLRLQMVTGGLFPYAETDIKIGRDGEEFFDTRFEYEPIKGSEKLKVLLEDLEEVSKDTSIIIWARFRGEIEAIYEALNKKGYSCGTYYGGSKPEIIERFKKREIRILIANPIKGGEGLNLQIATLHYFYSNSFKADSRLQAEDRSHRIGQTNKVTYKDLICKNTLDEKIFNILKRKESLIDYFRSIDNNSFMEEI
jgi:SNF2 family DNA or RNA helicase